MNSFQAAESSRAGGSRPVASGSAASEDATPDVSSSLDVFTAFAMMNIVSSRGSSLTAPPALPNGTNNNETSASDGASRSNPDECNCENSFNLLIGKTLPLLQPLPQTIVDVWVASPEAWANNENGPVVTWDLVRDMYDPRLTNPIDPTIMDAFTQVVSDCSDRDGLFLNTLFYDTIGKFCLCQDGKCKHKLNMPLESALKDAGHEGIRLYNYDRIFFPVKIRGFWVAVMLDATSRRNLMFDPCGLYYDSRDTISHLASDIEFLLKGEVTKFPPGRKTAFDKHPIQIVTPPTAIDPRYGALLVVCALEIFAGTGLPDYIDDLVMAFTSLATLVATGGRDSWGTSVSKMFSPEQHAKSCGQRPPAQSKAKPTKRAKKTKNLKARIANVNKVKTLKTPSPSASAVAPPAKSTEPKDTVSLAPPPPPSIKDNPQSNEVPSLISEMAKKFKNDFAAVHAAAKAKYGERKITTNTIEKSLLDRVLWTIGMNMPSHLPKDFGSVVQNEFETLVKAQSLNGLIKGKARAA